MKKCCLIIIIFLLFLFSCIKNKLGSEALFDDFFVALKSGSYDAMQDFYDDLDNVKTMGSDSLKYEVFRYKILALSSMGEYEQIGDLLEFEKYPDKVEYWIARGFLCEVLQSSESCVKDFEEALTVLSRRKQASVSEVAATYYPIEVYIRLLLNPDFQVDINQVDNQFREIVYYYMSLNREDLLLSSPFFIFYTSPFVSREKNGNSDWWN